MMKRRHHFVPRFYLRAFASAPRRIHVLNLERNLPIQDASLRDQCHRHRLYGKRDDLEDALGEIEGRAAAVLAKIVLERRPPGPCAVEYYTLLEFAGLQLLRTTAALERVMAASRDLAGAVFEGRPPPGFASNETESIALSLSTLPEMVASMEGLGTHVIVADVGHEFITSDNPAVRYNHYCEGIVGRGVTGTNCRGFQLFLPLSRHVVALLYDAGVYKVGRGKAASWSIASAPDVAILNGLQIVNAETNVYFGNWEYRRGIQALAEKLCGKRTGTGTRLVQADEVGGEGSVLIHQYTEMPRLQLNLSFIRLRRAARRVDPHERAQKYRKTRPRPDGKAPLPGFGGRKITFRVRESETS
jgi:hypothetical protein